MTHRHRGIRQQAFIIITAAALAAAVTPGPSAAEGPPAWPRPGTDVRLTWDSANQFDPAISGSRVVYTGDNAELAKGTDIYYLDGLDGTQTPVQVTDVVGDQQLSDISGDLIVYRDFHGEADVVVHDISTGTSTNLTEDSTATAGNPAISGNLVAWEDWRYGNLEIVAEDLATGAFRRLTDWSESDSNPAVSNGRIVWVRVTSGHRDLWYYDWATGESGPVTGTDAAALVPTAPDREESDPDISGNTVVYQARAAGEQDVYAFDFDTGTETRLSRPGLQRAASVSGRLVAFEDIAPGDILSHIAVWDLVGGTVTVLTQGPSSQTLTDIDGLSVVYTNNDGSQQDVYVHRLPPAPGDDSTPPVVTVPAAVSQVTASRSGSVVLFAATAVDETDGVLAATCAPVPGSLFPLGDTTVTCTATDAAGNTGSAAFTVNVHYAWSGVLQPVNADGSSIFKAGSTVPGKFRLTGASTGIADAIGVFSYRKTSSVIEGDVLETVPFVSPTAGNQFRYDPAAGQYVYNWSTKGLKAGTYEVRIDLGDDVTRSLEVSLR